MTIHTEATYLLCHGCACWLSNADGPADGPAECEESSLVFEGAHNVGAYRLAYCETRIANGSPRGRECDSCGAYIDDGDTCHIYDLLTSDAANTVTVDLDALFGCMPGTESREAVRSVFNQGDRSRGAQLVCLRAARENLGDWLLTPLDIACEVARENLAGSGALDEGEDVDDNGAIDHIVWTLACMLHDSGYCDDKGDTSPTAYLAGREADELDACLFTTAARTYTGGVATSIYFGI